MSFLAPLFLFGTLVVAGPIIIHLIRRSTKERTPFSSLMFLEPTPPRVTRRSRLENLWLLLLRCLAILLLAFGFARPFFPQPTHAAPSAGARQRVVVIVDASASMKRGDLWQRAQERVGQIAKRMTPGDELALLSFARGTSSLVTFEQWRGTPLEQRVPALLAKLEAAAPNWESTHLGAALLQAAELLDAHRDTPGTSDIVVVGDLQEGAKLDGLQGFAWPKQVRVTLEALSSDAVDNASAQWLAGSEAPIDGREAKVRLRVQSASAAKREQFRLQWQPGGPAAGLDVYVPAGQARVAESVPPPGAERVLLTGDSVDFDNTLFVLPPAPAKFVVLYLGKESPADSQAGLFYIQRSFPATASQTVEVVTHPPDPVPAAYELQRGQMMILGTGMTDATIAAARVFASEGRIVLFPITSAAAGPALARLAGVSELPMKESPAGRYALLGSIDFGHPIFAPFADPRYSDFTKIRFWKHRVLDPAALPNARVITRFDDGAPALLQIPSGTGSIVVLTSGWQPADSQLALSSKFVPLLHAMLEQSSGAAPRAAQHFIGDSVPMPPGAQPWKVQTPSGKELDVAADGTFADTSEPGIYTINPGGIRFVVNLAPEESRLQPMEPSRLSSLGVPLQLTAAEAAETPAPNPAAIQAAEMEARQKFWRWLIAAALVVLLLETLIATRLSQPPPQPVSS